MAIMFCNVMAEHRDTSRLHGIEMGDKGKKCRLASPIES